MSGVTARLESSLGRDMRKDNTLFFVAGLAFGVLIGYFLFQSLIATSGVQTVSSPVQAGSQPVTSQPVIDPREMAALERAAADNPDDAKVRERMGTLYLEAGEYDQATRWLSAAVKLNGGDLHTRNHLALSLAGQGRLDEAIAEYEAALTIDPAHPQSLLGLGRVLLYGKNDMQRGLEVWEKLIEVAPNSPEAESIREGLETLKEAHSG